MNAEIKPVQTAAESALAEAFAAGKAALPGGQAVLQAREAAFQRFEQRGLPHRRIEEWKYTDLRALMREAKPLAPPPDAEAKQRAKSAGALLAGLHAHRLVFIDGVFVPELCDQSALAGVSVGSLAAALARSENLAAAGADGAACEDVAHALNTAFMSDGAVVRIARDVAVARPIHLVFAHGAGKATAQFTRSHVVVEAGARATLVESHEGPDGIDYQVNTALDLVVGEGAMVDHIKITAEGDAALHISTLNAMIGQDARFGHFTFTIGGAIVRNQLFVTCGGKDSTLQLSGVNLLRRRQHADTTLVLDHAVGGCTSRELFKSVLDEESRGVFQGKIIVRPQAQRTDARMMTRALLLSQDAEADNKPELEIFADDVQCGHGATAGALDEDLKFYLMARGIPARQAEALLVEAFVGEAIDTVAHEGVRDALRFAAARWLGARG